MTPPGDDGPAEVAVHTAGGIATGTFRYVATDAPAPIAPAAGAPPAPTISSITPSSGTAAGGTLVTIRGANFYGLSQVTFDGIPGHRTSWVSNEELTVLTPAGWAGTVPVVVHAAGGTATTTFTYADVNAPTTGAGSGVLRRPDRPVRIMATGDSITFGIGDGGPGELGWRALRGGYRFPLWEALTRAGWAVNPVGPNTYPPNPPYPADSPWDGSGWAGWSAYTTKDLLGEGTQNRTGTTIADWVRDHDPDVILLHIGTNDGTNLPTRRADLERVLATVRSVDPGVHVVVAQLLINRSRNWTYINDINAMVRDVVADGRARGEPLRTVDMQNALTGWDDYWDEGHPNEQGYTKMANAWLGALVAADRGESRPDSSGPVAGAPASCDPAGRVRRRASRPGHALGCGPSRPMRCAAGARCRRGRACPRG